MQRGQREVWLQIHTYSFRVWGLGVAAGDATGLPFRMVLGSVKEGVDKIERFLEA